jgi:alpha-tubulin suppressor-like RCC1 family protein
MGQIGDGYFLNAFNFTIIDTPELNQVKILKISSNDFHNCLLASNNKIYCWGSNS